jgi:hypothetical protein
VTRYWIIACLALVAALSVSQCRSANTEKEIAQSSQAVAEGSTLAAHDAGLVLDGGRTRDERTARTAEKNRELILQAPGADSPVPPAVLDAVNLGMCQYASTPGCAEVLGQHSAELPETR